MGDSTSTGADPEPTTASVPGDSSGEGVTQGSDTSGSVEPTTAGDSTTDVDPTASTSTGEPPETGGEACSAPDPAPQFTWSIELPASVGENSVTADCIVADEDEQGPEMSVTLDCTIDGAQETVVLSYTIESAQPEVWPLGEPVVLDYRVESPWWVNEWLAVRTESHSLFNAIRAVDLAPTGIPPKEFFMLDGPLLSVSLEETCEPEPNRCGMLQRLALGMTIILDDGRIGSLDLASGEHAALGFPTLQRIWVNHASRLLEPIGCIDASPQWVEALWLLDSSGA